MRFAIEYYGIDHVMYGTDYPCWDPAACLRLLEEVGCRCRKAEALLRQRPPHLRPQGPADDKNARASVGVTYRTSEAMFVTAALVYRVSG